SRLEHPRLTPRNLDFRPAAQLHVQLPAGAGIHGLDELDVDDLAPVRAEEALRVKSLFETAERTAEQRANVAPVQSHVVAFGDDQAHLVQWHEPAARAVAYEKSLDDLRGWRCTLSRQRSASSRERAGESFRFD